MISRKNAVEITKAVAKGTWNNLPSILSVIPATAIAGKVLTEIKKIATDVEQTKKDVTETKEDVKEIKAQMEQIKEANGGEENLREQILAELKNNRDPKNPKYINCAVFRVREDDSLSEEDMSRILSVLTFEETVEDTDLNRFVELFIEDYFDGDMTECDYPYELEPEYLAFNFDEWTDHEYSEEDLVLIRDELNKIVGRQVFDEYEGCGTDDSVGY